MARPWFSFTAALLLLVVSGCASAEKRNPADQTPGSGGIAQLKFSPTVYPDATISGSEPALEAAPDGSIYVSKHLGQRASRVWKSVDSSAFTEVSPRPVGGQDVQAGFSGDGELGTDSSSNVYYSDLYLASASLYTSRDGGRTWTPNPAASPIPVIDRQWIDAFGDGMLYLSGNQLPGGAVTSFSQDHGRTFTPATPITVAGGGHDYFENRPIVDKATGRFFVPVKDAATPEQFVAITSDHGRAWTLRHFRTAPPGDNDVSQVAPLARDAAGTLYWTSLESFNGNFLARVYVSKDEGQSWSGSWTVPAYEGSKVFLWTRAREAGHLAVAWFGTTAKGTPDTADGRWDLFVADIHRMDTSEPSTTISRVNQVMVKNGVVCTGGATCTGNRELGDFFEMEFAPDGRLHFAWAEFRGGTPATTVAYAHQV